MLFRSDDKDGILAEVPDDFIETQCSTFMDHGMPGDFIKTPFEAEQKHKYKPFSDQYEGTGVVRKKSETSRGDLARFYFFHWYPHLLHS